MKIVVKFHIFSIIKSFLFKTIAVLRKYKSILMLIIVILILLIIISLHRIFPNHFIIKLLFTPNQSALEVELIGSGMLAIIIGLTSYFIQEEFKMAQNEITSARIFQKIVIPSLTNALKRTPSALNTIKADNSKAYFDNTSINNVHDAIEKYINDIYTYHDYYPNDPLSKMLLLFFDLTEKGYILGEELDKILIKMSAHVRHPVSQEAEFVIFFKAINYAKFDEEETREQLQNPRIHKLINLIEQYYAKPDNDTKQAYKNQFDILNTKMNERIATLSNRLEKIRIEIIERVSDETKHRSTHSSKLQAP